MSVPKDILAVERPKNTYVVAYGKNKNLYAVRKRIGCRYDKGRRIPINGPTIGHIIDGKFVPKEQPSESIPDPVSMASVDLKDWGAVTLCNDLCHDLLEELYHFYDHSDAQKIYCAAILRVCNPGIKDYELKEAYDNCFLSELYPGVALSKNTVSKFWSDLGKACSRIYGFMKNRAAAVEGDHHVLVDGTLKSNESKINTLSDFSRKAKTKGTRDISLLYAYDLEAREPVCSKCFPGNMLDATAYEAFLEDNGISKGIIVGDKGFPSSSAKKIFAKNKGLHYLNPLKRDSKYINELDLLIYEGQLPEQETILYRKAFSKKDGKWLYSYRDTSKAHKEEYDWLHRSMKEKQFSIDRFDEDWYLFGTIILESDLDMEPQDAYNAYDSRWEIELVMRYYKQACEFDETRVHTDYSIIGSEFCSFISSVMTFRLLKKYEKSGLLRTMTYKKILSVLTRAKKICVDGKNWQLIKMNPSHIKVLQALSLLPKPTPKRNGRPPKVGV